MGKTKEKDDDFVINQLFFGRGKTFFYETARKPLNIDL